MRRTHCLYIGLLLAAVAFAGKKEEDALAQQLAAARADNARLAASLSKLSSGAAARTRLTQQASDAAAINATLAQTTANRNAEVASLAASAAASVSHAEFTKLFILQVFGYLAMVTTLAAGLFGVRMKARADRKWFLEDAAAHRAEVLEQLKASKTALEKLETNTNNKMDKLLEAKDQLRVSTNASARAEGKAEGKAEGSLPAV